MLPKVRTWTVRYYLDRTLLAEIEVEAPTKLFAKWTARDHFRAARLDRYLAANRETVAPARATSYH